MIEIYKKTLKDYKLYKIGETEVGSWISVVNPTKKEMKLLEETFDLDAAILEDALDENEIPRLEKGNGSLYMIIRFPTKDKAEISTMPILVVVAENNIITLCKEKNEVISAFVNEKIEFYTTLKTNFLLKIILEVFNVYDYHLNRILKDIKSKKIKIDNLENKDILFLVHEEETLNNFTSSLVPISNVLERILSGRYIATYEKDKDVAEDLFMDSKQTLELSMSGLKSIKNIREAYSAILTNELNKVMKILTVVTIVLTIPTIVSSIFGMNVILPMENNPLAFLFIIIVIILLSVLFFVIIKKKRWI